VPAVLISPFIPPGMIVHDVFDHTSVIATAMKLFAPGAWPSDVLGQRAKNANTFEAVLNLDMSPRMEIPVYATPSVAAHTSIATYLSSLQQEAVAHAAELERQLPVDKQTGIDLATIKDEKKAGAYLSQVASRLQQFSKRGRSFDN
jgi:phospholipase C